MSAPFPSSLPAKTNGSGVILPKTPGRETQISKQSLLDIFSTETFLDAAFTAEITHKVAEFLSRRERLGEVSVDVVSLFRVQRVQQQPAHCLLELLHVPRRILVALLRI